MFAGLLVLGLTPLVWYLGQMAHNRPERLRLMSAAIRLHAGHDFGAARALLVERCQPGAALSARPEAEQDRVIAALLRRLWIAPARGHPVPSLDQMCRQWAAEFGPAADLDPDRVLAWLFARCVPESAAEPALAEVARAIAP